MRRAGLLIVTHGHKLVLWGVTSLEGRGVRTSCVWVGGWFARMCVCVHVWDVDGVRTSGTTARRGESSTTPVKMMNTPLPQHHRTQPHRIRQMAHMGDGV